MKVLYQVLILSFAFLAISCDDTDVDACQFSDPLEELDWLKQLKTGFDMSSQPAGSQIVMYTYQDQMVFWVDPCVNCSDGLISVYNCDGDVICEFGGIAGVDTCPDFSVEATDRQVLYTNVCDSPVIPDADKYDGESAHYFINSAEITGHCLEIEFASSGCSGDSWTWEMIDAEQILESYPVQRNLKLVLNNPEACQAVFTKTTSFDLQPIQLQDYGEIILNLDGFTESLLYSYNSEKSFIKNKTWTLVKVDGGLVPSEFEFEAGLIKWSFDQNEVVVDNGNTSQDKEDFFDSGSYQYEIKESNNGEWFLEVDGQNLGYLNIISIDEFWADGRSYDGLRLVFKASQ